MKRHALALALATALAGVPLACDDGGDDPQPDMATTATVRDATSATDTLATNGDASTSEDLGADTEEIFIIGADTTAAGDTTSTDVPTDMGSVDTPEAREARFRAGIDVLQEAQEGFCACASDPAGGWCNDLPAECFADVPACLAETQPFGDETVAQCAVEALNMYPAEADALLDCQEQPTLTYRECITGVSAACTTLEIIGCGQPFVEALEACRQAPALDQAMDACSQ